MTVTPQVRKLETSANYGKFDIEPLDPGFGTTLGNTLLRDVKGPAEVRASHIQASSDVEIVNPDLYICTLAAKGHLRMELNVERGKGYVPAERNKREGQPIGVIPIDSIFSPV